MIRLENVSARLNGHEILHNISASFPQNSFTCFVGPNGSGKTTLLKTIAGLMKHSRGEIYLKGRMLSKCTPGECARILAYMPQSRQTPDITVQTLIEHGRFPHLGFTNRLTEKDYAIVKNAAKITGVTGLLERRLTQLSGGERQRVYLAMAVAQDTEIILLDEPTTHLDIHYQLEILHIIESFHHQGKTIIMVAHDLPQAFTYAKNINVLCKGNIICGGTPEHVCTAKEISSVFGVSLQECKDSGGVYHYQIKKET